MVDSVPVCVLPVFSVSNKRVEVDHSLDQFVVQTRVVQLLPRTSRARIAQAHLEETCAAAGTDSNTVRWRTVEHYGGVLVAAEKSARDAQAGLVGSGGGGGD